MPVKRPRNVTLITNIPCSKIVIAGVKNIFQLLIKVDQDNQESDDPCKTLSFISLSDHNKSFSRKMCTWRVLCWRAQPGFEPGTSRTQSENHTPRPLSHINICRVAGSPAPRHFLTLEPPRH